MMLRRHSVFAAAVLTASVLGSGAFAQDVTRTPLQTYPLPTVATDAVTVLAEIKAGGTTGRHTHPGVEMSFVADGQITLKVDGQPDKAVKAGESFMIDAMKVHEAVATADKNAKIVVTYVVTRGQPVTTPAP